MTSSESMEIYVKSEIHETKPAEREREGGSVCVSVCVVYTEAHG